MIQIYNSQKGNIGGMDRIIIRSRWVIDGKDYGFETVHEYEQPILKALNEHERDRDHATFERLEYNDS